MVPLHPNTDASGASHIHPPQPEPCSTSGTPKASSQVCVRSRSQAAFGGEAGGQCWLLSLQEGAGNLSHLLLGGRELLSCGSPSSALRAVPRVSLVCLGLPSLEGNVFVYAALPDFLCFLALGHSFHASLSVFINTNFFLSPRSAGEFLSGFYVPARLCVNSQQCYQ